MGTTHASKLLNVFSRNTRSLLKTSWIFFTIKLAIPLYFVIIIFVSTLLWSYPVFHPPPTPPPQGINKFFYQIYAANVKKINKNIIILASFLIKVRWWMCNETSMVNKIGTPREYNNISITYSRIWW